MVGIWWGVKCNRDDHDNALSPTDIALSLRDVTVAVVCTPTAELVNTPAATCLSHQSQSTNAAASLFVVWSFHQANCDIQQ